MNRNTLDNPNFLEAIALLEIDSLPRAIKAQDAALKKASVQILACCPVTPGKVVLVMGGDVASIEESWQEAKKIVGDKIIDDMFLPGIHEQIIPSLCGKQRSRPNQALAIVEMATVASTILSLDGALKTAAVDCGRIHLASGYGGKGYYTLVGEQGEIEAAVETAIHLAGSNNLDYEVIPAPHDELDLAVFFRPWSLDPSIKK